MGDRHRGPRRRPYDPLARGDHRRRLPQPPEHPRHRRRRSVRRPLVAHGALAGGRRPEGQAGGGDRHRLHRLPDDPRARARGRPRHRVPAHAAVAVPRPRLSLAVPAAGQLARPQPAVPHQLHARPHLLARPHRQRRADRSGLRRSVRLQPAQQAGARRLHRVPGAQARRSGAGGGHDPAAPGLVGPGGRGRPGLLRPRRAAARQRHAGHQPGSSASSRAASRPRTARSTRST